jgi:hypothetical protein
VCCVQVFSLPFLSSSRPICISNSLPFDSNKDPLYPASLSFFWPFYPLVYSGWIPPMVDPNSRRLSLLSLSPLYAYRTRRSSPHKAKRHFSQVLAFALKGPLTPFTFLVSLARRVSYTPFRPSCECGTQTYWINSTPLIRIRMSIFFLQHRSSPTSLLLLFVTYQTRRLYGFLDEYPFCHIFCFAVPY